MVKQMINNKMIVKYISESRDGLSKLKVYNVSVIRMDSNGSLVYYIKDDNGQYNEYSSKHFEVMECYIEI